MKTYENTNKYDKIQTNTKQYEHIRNKYKHISYVQCFIVLYNYFSRKTVQVVSSKLACMR